jgi:hypothetical protein
MENKESLEARAVICKTPNFIKNDVDFLFANGVMTPRIYQPNQKHVILRAEGLCTHSCSQRPPSQ